MRKVWFPRMVLNWRGVRSCMAQGFIFATSGITVLAFFTAVFNQSHTVVLNINSFGEMWWEIPLLSVFGVAFVWWYFQERIYDI